MDFGMLAHVCVSLCVDAGTTIADCHLVGSLHSVDMANVYMHYVRSGVHELVHFGTNEVGCHRDASMRLICFASLVFHGSELPH